MRSKLSLFCDKIIEAGWLAAAIIVPLFFNIFSSRTFEPDKISLLRSIALVMSAAWLLRSAEDWRLRSAGEEAREARQPLLQRIVKTPLVLPTLLLVLVYLVSTAASVVPYTSLWGSRVRLQGTYSTLSYIVIFFLMLDGLRTKRQLNRLITTLILVSFPIALYGLVQHFGMDPLPWAGDVTRRVTSSMGNAIFVAAYLIMVVPLTLSRLLESWNEAVGDFEVADGLVGLASFAALVGALLAAMFLGRSGASPWLSWLVLLAGAVLAASAAFLRPAERRAQVLAISMPLTFAFLVGFVWVLEIPFPPADSKYLGWGLMASAVFMLAMVPFAFYLRKPVSRLLLMAGYFVIAIAQLITIFYSQSRGPQVGLLASLLFFLVVLGLVKRRIWLSWLMGGLAVMAVVVLLLFNTVDSPLVDKLRSMPYVGRLGTVFKTESGTAKVRVLIWQGASEMIGRHAPLEFPGEDGGPDKLNALRPIIGYGPESVYVAYNGFYPPDLAHFEKRNATPDRAHNETFDALMQTGLLGFAAYAFLFISLFYFAFRWLGLIQERWHKLTFVGLWIAGGIAGLIGFWAWRGPAYLGVGLPFGGVGGLAVYVLILLVQSVRKPELSQSWGGRYSLWILALITAILAHFVESQFGFGIAATRTYFWIGAGTLAVIGIRLAAQPVEAKELAARTPSPQQAQKSGSRRRRRGGGPTSETQARPLRERDWQGSVLTLSVVAILILSTMLFNYVTVQQDNPGLLSTIWLSLTRSRGEPSLTMLVMFLSTWAVIGLLGLSDLARQKTKTAGDWLTAAGVYTLVSLGGSFIFALLHAVRVRPIAITSADAPIPLADTITFYVAFVVLTLAAMACVLTFMTREGQTARPWRWTGSLPDMSVVALAVILPVLAIVLVATANIRIVRADILFKQGQSLENAKQWDAAMFFYERAIALDDRDDFYYLFQARTFMDMGMAGAGAERDGLFQKSENAMVKAWDLAPLNTDHPRNLAKLYLTWGSLSQEPEKTQRLNRALDYSAEAMKLSPHNAQLVNERGQIYSALGDYEQAIATFEHSLSLDSEYSQTYVHLGDLHLLQKEWAKAAEAYEKAIEIKRKTQSAYRNLGYAYTQMGDTEKALATYEAAVELWPNSFEDRKNLAILYRQVGRVDDAIREGEQALTLAPAGEKESMQTFLAQLGQPASALSADNAQKVQELTTAGQTQMNAKDWATAEQTFRQVLELDAQNAFAHSALAYIYAQLGQLDKAITENLAVLSLVPDDYHSHKNLAILYQQTGQIGKAMDETEQALLVAPQDEVAALEAYQQQLQQLQGELPATQEPGQRAGDLLPEERNNMYSAPPEMIIDPTKSYQATIVTKKGNIVVDLAAADAPQTVNNFVYLAKEGYYDGLTFHRVENSPGFALIQGGDPAGSGRGGPGYTVPAEIGLAHDVGAIAMARLGDQVNPERASSGSQFYICLVPIHQLDGGYTVFGYVVEGLDVASQIAAGDEMLTIVISEQ